MDRGTHAHPELPAARTTTLDELAPLSVVVVGLHFGRTIVDHLPSAAVRLVGVWERGQTPAATTASALRTRHRADLAAVVADPDVATVALLTGQAARGGHCWDVFTQAVQHGMADDNVPRTYVQPATTGAVRSGRIENVLSIGDRQ